MPAGAAGSVATGPAAGVSAAEGPKASLAGLRRNSRMNRPNRPWSSGGATRISVGAGAGTTGEGATAAGAGGSLGGATGAGWSGVMPLTTASRLALLPSNLDSR